MKRIEVSTEIGSLSVTYQKQKKVLVCLSGAGLLPSYENFSLILENFLLQLVIWQLIFRTQVGVRFMTNLEKSR